MFTLNDVIKLEFNEKTIEKTAINSIKKYRYSMINLMYSRTPVELIDNIFMGDFAKNCLLDHLRKYVSKTIIDYDEIRNDNFELPDPGWDFMIGDKQIKVEVKSSIPPNGENFQSIINKRDIKVTASHDKGKTMINPENLESMLHAQVYFYAKTYKNGYDSFETLYKDIENNIPKLYEIINVKKYLEPLFFGVSSKKEIISYSQTLNPNTWTFSWTDRIYWRSPISKAHTMSELISIADEK